MIDTPLRLLVVDDDPMHLELVARALARDGYDVRCAATAADLEREAVQLAPELVLVDMNMPDLPSEQAIALARTAAPHARVYIYSAWDEAKLRARCHELAADGYLSKSTPIMEMGGRLFALHRAVETR